MRDMGRERERERERQRHRKREKQAPCRKPDVGLELRTLGSCPEPKANVQPLSHPGVPKLKVLNAGSVPAKLLAPQDSWPQ